MTREEAKELLPIIQAFAEGKTIEFLQNNGEWDIATSPTWRSGLTYRIKPEKKYRPFKNKEECWQEMQKHQPFAWLKYGKTGSYDVISYLNDNKVYLYGNDDWIYAELMNTYTFADGTTFGIEEE